MFIKISNKHLKEVIKLVTSLSPVTVLARDEKIDSVVWHTSVTIHEQIAVFNLHHTDGAMDCNGNYIVTTSEIKCTFMFDGNKWSIDEFILPTEY